MTILKFYFVFQLFVMNVYQDENDGSSRDERKDHRGNALSVSHRTLAAVNMNLSKGSNGMQMKDKKALLQFPEINDHRVSQKGEQLQQNVRNHPTNTSAWWLLVHFYSAKCKLDPQQMLELCEKACSFIKEDKNDRTYAKLFLAQCKYLGQCHRYKEAIRLYKAMAINGIGKDLYYFWAGYASVLVKDHKVSTAIKVLKKAIERLSSPEDIKKLEAQIKEIENHHLSSSISTPKSLFSSNHQQTPIQYNTSANYQLATPSLNHGNSFDQEVSTPSCLVSGARPTPPSSNDSKKIHQKVDKIEREKVNTISPCEQSDNIGTSNDNTNSTPLQMDLTQSDEENTTESIDEQENDKESPVIIIDEEDEEEENDEEESPKRKFVKVNGKIYQNLGGMGKGGSGSVFKVLGKIGSGENQRTEVFALKQIKLNVDSESEVLKNEVKYLLSLRGERNVVHLYDYELTSSKLSLILELGEVDLRTVLRQISKNPLRINAIRVYWLQMLEAVDVIHSHRIVHTDLKPANFVICKGYLKLIDFGIAGVIQSNTTSFKRDSLVSSLIILILKFLLINF